MAYAPRLIVGIGADFHYYTLRQTFLRQSGYMENGVFIGYSEEDSYHICNLSQDAVEACGKLAAYAREKGIAAEATSPHDLHGLLNEIKRRGIAAIQADARHGLEAFAARMGQPCRDWSDLPETIDGIDAYTSAERARMFEARRMADALADIETAQAGVMPWGKHKGETIATMPAAYLRWLIQASAEPENARMKGIAAVVLKARPELAPIVYSPEHIGTIGKREVFTVEVIRIAWFDGVYGRTYITTMRGPGNACIVSKGAFAPEEGEKLTIKATVKAHDEYKGQAQTVVQRVAVI
jgi:hypothetical protein